MGLFTRDPLKPTLTEQFTMAVGGVFEFAETIKLGTVAKLAALGASAVMLVIWTASLSHAESATTPASIAKV